MRNYALVTGGSSGIGFAYASRLASEGYNIIIVSNREDLNLLSTEQIKKKYPVDICYITKDLTELQSAQEIFDFCQNNAYEVEVLVNNAGMFYFSSLVNMPIEINAKTTLLHVCTPTLLCSLFGNEMKKRNKGYILNASSICAWIPYPTVSIYGASKRYIKDLSNSLYFELGEFGVKVCAVCPGAVDTDLYNLSPELRQKLLKWGIMHSADFVAKKGINALFGGKSKCVPGKINFLFIFLVKITPDFIIKLIVKKYKTRLHL